MADMDMDRTLRNQLRKETDEVLFSGMDLSERVKGKVRQQANAEAGRRRRFVPGGWLAGAAAVAAAIMFWGLPMLQQPAAPPAAEPPVATAPPAAGGAAGSQLSQLVTTPLESAQAAKAAFGPELLLPHAAPEGYELSEMTAIGMEGEVPTRVMLTYVSGAETVTFVADRMDPAFPKEMFTQTTVNGVDGFVFEQPELVELFWAEGGIHYSITGPLTADEAMKLAETLE